jgi:hypothetical protein
VGADGNQFAYLNADFSFIFQDIVLGPLDLNPFGFKFTAALATRNPALGDPIGDAPGGGNIELGFQFFSGTYTPKSNEVVTLVDRATLNFNQFQDFTAYVPTSAAFSPLQAGDVMRIFVRDGVNGYNVDNVRVATVPEPAASSLALAALLGLAFVECARRRVSRR